MQSFYGNMTAADVTSLYSELENLNIEIWVDGGWSVDALLGEQTQPHKDLDIAIQQKDISCPLNPLRSNWSNNSSRRAPGF